MVLRFYKGTGPGAIFLIIVTLLAVWISAILNPKIDSLSLYETDPMPLYGLLKLIIGNNPLAGVAFSLLLVSFIAVLIVNFNNIVSFSNERSFLPAVIYILSGGFFPQYQILNPVLPASFFLMLAINRVMDGYLKPGIAYNFFDAGILISIGSLFYANLIWFGILVIIGFALIRTGELIEIVISILGFLTPFLFAFGVYYVIGKDLPALLSLVEKNLFGRSEGYLFPRHTIVALIFTGIFVFVSIVFLVRLMNTKKIKSRKAFSLLLWAFFISLIICLALPSVSVEIVWLTSIPASYFLAYYLILNKKKLVPEILFTLFFMLVMLIQVLYLI